MTANASKTSRRTPVQRRSLVTCGAILEATAQLLATAPPGEVSTNRIARRAGVSIGTLYQYFDSREAIIRALGAQHTEEMQALLRGSVQGYLGASVAEVVPAFIDAMIDAHRLAPALHLALVRELLVDGGESLRAVQDPAKDLVLAWLELHRDAVRPTDLPAAASLLTLTVEAAIHGQLFFDPARLGDLAWRRELVDLLLRYLLDDAPPR